MEETKNKEKINKPVDKSSMVKRKVEALRKRDGKMVRGMLRYHEQPGGTLSFDYSRYGNPVIHYDLVDSEPCTIPYGVAVHLNETGWYPVHRYERDEDGKPSKRIGRKVYRYGFQSLDFTNNDPNLDSAQSDIITIEKV